MHKCEPSELAEAMCHGILAIKPVLHIKVTANLLLHSQQTQHMQRRMLLREPVEVR